MDNDIIISDSTTESDISGKGNRIATEEAEQLRRSLQRFVRALFTACAECGTTEAEDYYAVPDDHLTFYGGDLLCGNCAPGHGVI